MPGKGGKDVAGNWLQSIPKEQGSPKLGFPPRSPCVLARPAHLRRHHPQDRTQKGAQAAAGGQVGRGVLTNGKTKSLGALLAGPGALHTPPPTRSEGVLFPAEGHSFGEGLVRRETLVGSLSG